MMRCYEIGKQTPIYKLDETTLEKVDSIKFLGITFDYKLNFNKHFTNIRNEYVPDRSLLRILKEQYLVHNKKLASKGQNNALRID